jgi:hypothetical protein
MWNIESPDTGKYISGFDFTLENNILFVYSRTGNKLYLLDKETFKINKKIQIKSPYTNIGKAPCSLEDRMKPYNDNYGQIQWVLYDKYNQLYYVTVTHEIPDSEKTLIKNETSFSIQIYNKNFKKLAEQFFDGKKYNPFYCILSSEGLLIRYNSFSEAYNLHEIQYDLYELKK